MSEEAPSKLRRYYRTKMPRLRIERMLSRQGSMAIQRILEDYNENWKHGLTMPQLSNILAGDPRFEKTEERAVACSILGNRYEATVWRVVKCQI